MNIIADPSNMGNRDPDQHVITPQPTVTNSTAEIYAQDVIVNSPAVMYTLVVLQLLAIVCAIIGNLFLIVMILKTWRRAKRQVTMYFILNLAICDLLSAALHQPMRLVDIVFDDGIVADATLYCKITGFCSALIGGVAFHSITAISIDRYVLICHPMKARSLLTVHRAKITLCIIWISTCLFMIPLPILFTSVVNLRLNEERNSSFCLIDIVSDKTDARIYFYGLFLMYFVIPLFIITICYSRVFYVLHKGTCMVNGSSDSNTLRMLRTRKAVAKMMLLIAVLFIICESPYFITFFYRSLGFKLKTNPVTILLIIECLPLIYAVANPIVYGSHSCCNRKRFIALLGGRDHSRMDTYRSDATFSGSLKGGGGAPVKLKRPHVVTHWCHKNNGAVVNNNDSTDL